MRNGLQEPTDGALARLTVDSEHWAEELPPVPAGHRVTVAFATDDLTAAHGEAMELLGYRVVGTWGQEDPAEQATADFLVRAALIEAHPAWWRMLTNRAAQVYVLELGPTRLVLGQALRIHMEAG